VPASELAAAAPEAMMTATLEEALAGVPRGGGHPPVLICGSLYLVGQALALLGGHASRYERSAQ
jgi:folylpolyglutamate synthase/dihydropteroate synthase